MHSPFLCRKGEGFKKNLHSSVSCCGDFAGLKISQGKMDIEEDPAAAFLAREQDELSGIVDDTLGFSSEQAVGELLAREGSTISGHLYWTL